MGTQGSFTALNGKGDQFRGFHVPVHIPRGGNAVVGEVAGQPAVGVAHGAGFHSPSFSLLAVR